MGRPPIPPEERHRNRVSVNFTDREYSELVKLAGEDESVGTLIRRIVKRYLGRQRR